MQILECAYCYKGISWIGTKMSTCGLIHEHTKATDTYYECEQVPISKCPYKLYSLGKIDKIELNKRVGELTNVQNNRD